MTVNSCFPINNIITWTSFLAKVEEEPRESPPHSNPGPQLKNERIWTNQNLN